MEKLNRRDFLKMAGMAIAAPGLLKRPENLIYLTVNTRDGDKWIPTSKGFAVSLEHFSTAWVGNGKDERAVFFEDGGDGVKGA